MSPDISLRKVAACSAVAALMLLLPVTEQFTAGIRFTAAIGLLMAALWLTEAIPMGMTALIPLIAFPVAGVASAEKIAAPYANPAVFLFLGGFLLSSMFERWGLHKRLAYFALTRVGTEPRRIVLAVICATAFLSMWISNTATTLMMCPIAVAIVSGLGASRMDRDSARDGDSTLGPRTFSGGGIGMRRATAEATLLGVAYAASLGGLATPIGTPTNLIFLGAAKQLFPNEHVVTFAEWMLFGLAYLVVLVPVCWVIVIVTAKVPRGAAIPIETLGLEKPGKIGRAEMTALFVCAVTALLWMTRADVRVGSITIPGWSDLLPGSKMIGDATVAIAMALVAFLLPGEGHARLLPWEELKRVPWDVLILFGGGFALAEALEASGFSKWAGDNLAFVGKWPAVLMILTICILVTMLSEVASNVATATAMMPIAAALAPSIGVHPYFLMIPAVMASSSGFMLPVATAPNTIVYSTGFVRVRAMSRSGFLLDIAAALVITALIFTIIPWATGVAMR